MNEIVERNPFAAAQVAARPTQPAAGQAAGMLAVESQRVLAEVQAQMLMARANPRDPIAAMDRILNACTRPTLAQAAIYQYSRGGSDVAGPSIRLAEAMAQAWGNIKTSVRELEQRDGMSIVQAIAWDLETGYSSDKVFQVPHIRHTRQGAKRLEDPRDIYENTANNAARRLRACILAVIPGDVTEAAVAQCETTMHTNADTSPEAVQKLVKAFAEFGVTKEQVEKRIQRRLDAIQPAQIVSLRKVYASLRDGMSVAADWFDPIDGEQQAATGAPSAADKAKDAIRARGKKPEPTAAPAPAQPPAKTVEQYKADIENATGVETAQLVLDEARDVLTPTELEDLNRAYTAAWEA